MKPVKITPLTDLHVTGPASRQIIVRANPDDPRPWLYPSPTCPLLTQNHIAHVGIMRASAPYEVVRTDQSGTFMLACFEGEGVVLVDGAWKKISKGNACLLPPFVMNTFKCLPGKSWKFAWVRYDESRETTPIISSLSPVAGVFDSLALKFAIEGLFAESSGAASPSAQHHWTELIHLYVKRFAEPRHPDDRLWRVWQKVEADIAKDWTLADLASIACVSEEHLRRLCRKELGRSPMQHLTFLRLKKARELLAVTDDKVEIIAQAVGFKNTFVFSNTFKNWIGVRPSEYRQAK